MIGESIFFEIAAILCLATLLAIVGQKLRQPLIIMFLATGILAGPSVLGIVQSYDQIELLAQIGIALLLFIVGLKLDLQLIRTTGPVALATGFGQIVFTSAIGLLIAVGLGMTLISAAYIAVALTFSSTIIIVKLLSDKKEIDSLHGQIAIGFLIVQDIAAILALVGLTSLGSTLAAQDSVLLTFLSIAAKGLGLLIVVGLLMKFALTPPDATLGRCARIAGPVRHLVGHSARHSKRTPRLRKGSRGVFGRDLTGLHGLSRRNWGPSDQFA